MNDGPTEQSLGALIENYRGYHPSIDILFSLATLIFLRWADFEDAEREAIAGFEGTPYEPVLPSKYHWRTWCHLRSESQLERLIQELPSVLERCGNHRQDSLATQLYRIAPVVVELSRLNRECLGNLVGWLARQPFETPKDRQAIRDQLDRGFRNYRDKFSGEYSTPDEITSLMVRLANPKKGESVYDPCFGYAGLLTQAINHVGHEDKKGNRQSAFASYATPPLRIAGVEKRLGSYVLGLTRLVLSGIHSPQVELGNSLERQPPSNPLTDGFDVVLANPPWGAKVDLKGSMHYTIDTKDSTSLFLQHALSQLRPGGRLVMVVPPSFLFRGGRELELRKWLAEEHSIEKILSIPHGAFAPFTGIETAIVVIRRGSSTTKIRFVDGARIYKSGNESTERIRGPKAKLIRPLIDEFFKRIDGTVQDDFQWDLSIEDLRKLDYDLTPRRRDRSGLDRILESLPMQAAIENLGDCCSVTLGRTIPSGSLSNELPESKEETNSPVPYIRVRDLQKGSAGHASSWILPTAASGIDPKYKLRAGDILFSRSGAIGKAGIVRNGAVGAIASHTFLVIRPLHDAVDPHYVLAYLQSAEVIAWLEDRSRGSAVKQLPMESILKLPVAIPPLQIQQRIADEHRLLQVDALAYLSELLSEDSTRTLSKDLNDWVALNLQTLEQSQLNEPIDTFLERLELLAALSSPIDLCARCGKPYHIDESFCDRFDKSLGFRQAIRTTCTDCLIGDELSTIEDSENAKDFFEQSPLIKWALDFGWITESMARITKVPDMSTVYAILLSVQMKLSNSLEKIQGDLPSQQRARELTSELNRHIGWHLSVLVLRTRLEIDVIWTEYEACGTKRLSFRVSNKGRLPLSDLEFSLAHPWVSKQGNNNLAIIPFLGAGAVCEIEFVNDPSAPTPIPTTSSKTNSKPLAVESSSMRDELQLNWVARRISGDREVGAQRVAIEFESPRDSDAKAATPYERKLVGSPYICGDPVKPERSEMFFGRNELLEKIRRSVITSGNVVLLEGNRRSGKSSILFHMEGDQAIPGWLGIYCSLQGAEGASVGGIPTVEVFRAMAYAIAQGVRKSLGSAPLPDGTMLDATRKTGIQRAIGNGIRVDSPFQDFREYIDLVLSYLSERKLGILLMLDEFDKLQEGINNGVTSPQVPENIRFLVQSLQGFTAILTGSRRLKRLREEYWSALFGLGTRMGVTSLASEDTEQLIVEPAKQEFAYTRPAVELCIELTAGQPYLIQCLCNRIFDDAIARGYKSITVDHIERAVQSFVVDNEHFATLWDFTQSDRRRYLLALLWQERDSDVPMTVGVIQAKMEEAGVEVREESLISDIEELIELELIDRNGSATSSYYSLSIPMMGLWIDTQQDVNVLQSRARSDSFENPGSDNSNGALD